MITHKAYKNKIFDERIDSQLEKSSILQREGFFKLTKKFYFVLFFVSLINYFTFS